MTRLLRQVRARVDWDLPLVAIVTGNYFVMRSANAADPERN
jgi:hypothetical protein